MELKYNHFGNAVEGNKINKNESGKTSIPEYCFNFIESPYPDVGIWGDILCFNQ